MTYRLFIDDERYPVDVDWLIARSSEEAINYVLSFGLPSEIAFDHDLGGEDTTRRFIFWLGGYLVESNEKFPRGFKFTVHSQNPAGVQWITGTVNNLIQHFGIET